MKHVCSVLPAGAVFEWKVAHQLKQQKYQTQTTNEVNDSADMGSKSIAASCRVLSCHEAKDVARLAKEEEMIFEKGEICNVHNSKDFKSWVAA